jgi:hypothetical protein
MELKPGQGLAAYFREIDQLHGELAQDKDLKLSEKWLKLITYKGLPCDYDTVRTLCVQGNVSLSEARAMLREMESNTATALNLHLAAMPKKLCTRVLHSDQGGEYTGKEMQEVLRKWGIRPLTSPAYTPEYNGVAERFNRTMGDMVWCLLIDTNLQ